MLCDDVANVTTCVCRCADDVNDVFVVSCAVRCALCESASSVTTVTPSTMTPLPTGASRNTPHKYAVICGALGLSEGSSFYQVGVAQQCS